MYIDEISEMTRFKRQFLTQDGILRSKIGGNPFYILFFLTLLKCFCNQIKPALKVTSQT